MERQVKERLIGAAVLVAAAIILVPEMLSGPEKSAAISGETASSPVKTYSIDLQPSSPSSESAAPAAAPQPPPEIPEAKSAEPETAVPAGNSIAEPTVDAAAPAPETAKPNAVETPQSAATETRPPATPTPAVQKKATGGWVVQVGSFSTQAKAQSVARGLEKRGLASFVRTATVNGKVWYRVRIGPMSERSAAESMLAKVKVSEPGASVVSQ